MSVAISWCFYLFLSCVSVFNVSGYFVFPAAAISFFTACSTRHCGTSACCLRWRWEGSLLCLRVGFSFLCGSAGGWAESLSSLFFDVVCYVVRHVVVSKIGNLEREVGCCESRMVERSHWWTERWLMSPLSLSFLSLLLTIYLRAAKRKGVSKAKRVSGRKRQVFLNPRNMNGRLQLTVNGFLRTFDFPKCENSVKTFFLYIRDSMVFWRFGHDLGMSFLNQRFHGDLLASFNPGMS